MPYLITIHNLHGVTQGAQIYQTAPAHLPNVGDEISFRNSDGEPKSGFIKGRHFRLGAYEGGDEVILTVDYNP